MERWKLKQYNKVWTSFRAGCSEKMRVLLDSRLDHLLDKGYQCGLPASRSLKDGLFELRGKADNQEARLTYYFGPNRTIIFTHGFYKHGRGKKAIDREIAIGRGIKKIIEKERSKNYALNLIN